jgi:hypothetical protein
MPEASLFRGVGAAHEPGTQEYTPVKAVLGPVPMGSGPFGLSPNDLYQGQQMLPSTAMMSRARSRA